MPRIGFRLRPVRGEPAVVPGENLARFLAPSSLTGRRPGPAMAVRPVDERNLTDLGPHHAGRALTLRESSYDRS